MNKHMREHSRRLSIKTTRLASLTAIFRSKKQQKSPATGHSHPPTTDAVEANDHDGPDGLVGSLEVVPEEQTLQLDDSGADDNDGSDGNGGNEGTLMDFNSDEFESDEESVGCDVTEEGRGLLEFEMRAADAGNVCHEHRILRNVD
jgi:hypothetical protein